MEIREKKGRLGRGGPGILGGGTRRTAIVPCQKKKRRNKKVLSGYKKKR